MNSDEISTFSKSLPIQLLLPPRVFREFLKSFDTSVLLQIPSPILRYFQKCLTLVPKYMFKINNGNTRARCKICSKLTTNTIEGFLFKTLSTQMPTRYYTPLKSGTTEHVNDNILRLRGHGNK